jgi:hypothetical protein
MGVRDKGANRCVGVTKTYRNIKRELWRVRDKGVKNGCRSEYMWDTNGWEGIMCVGICGE